MTTNISPHCPLLSVKLLYAICMMAPFDCNLPESFTFFCFLSLMKLGQGLFKPHLDFKI